MKSITNLGYQPAGAPLLADDILEFHAARLILLVSICGKKKRTTGFMRLDGLTKLAKLDFLVRYPEFYEKLAEHLKKDPTTPIRTIESSMVRFHYGPWDDRYYHILAYLEGKRLLEVTKEKSTYQFGLSAFGTVAAETFAASDAYADLVQHMQRVRDLVGNMNGTPLKSLIYEVFGKEVVERKLGERIT